MNIAAVLSGPATCLPNDCFCEGIAGTWVKQPTNTWSSLAFVVAGFGLLALPARSLPKLLRVTYACCVIAIGVASGSFHASLSFVGQWLDVSSMYAYAALLTSIHLYVLRVLSGRAAALTFVSLTALTALLAAVAPTSRRVVFDVLLGVALVSLLRVAYTTWCGVSRRPLVWAVGAFAAASTAWVLDLRRVWCTPSSAFSGHALWHVLGALATAWVFAYYRAGFAATAAASAASHTREE